MRIILFLAIFLAGLSAGLMLAEQWPMLAGITADRCQDFFDRHAR